jgi:VCBS repeat-containing protein
MNRKTHTRSLTKLALAAAAVVASVPSFAVTVDLWAKGGSVSMPDGTQVAIWGFASSAAGVATVPGPAIVVPVGDPTLTINLTNNLGEPVSIVIPGLGAPLSPVLAGGRVQSFTAEAAAGDGTATYTWSNVRPGTYLYQSGSRPAKQVPMGLYGAVTKDEAAGTAYPGVAYDAQVLLVYSELDDTLNAGSTASQPLNYLPDYFLVNGQPYTAGTTFPAGSAGQSVLVRFVNAGLKTHVPTLTSGYWDVVAEDGGAYPYRRRQFAVALPAGKTADVLWTPSESGTFNVVDRAGYLTTGTQTGGGMLAKLAVAGSAVSAVADAFAATEDAPLAIVAPGVLANDTAGTTAVLVAATTAGSLSLAADGSFTYTPSANFDGTDSFTYTADSAGVSSNVATVTITVSGVNDAPVAANDAASTTSTATAGTPVTIDVLANDADVDGDALSVSILAGPVSGVASVNGDGTITYAPNAGFSGSDAFTYQISDGALVASATVTIAVSGAVLAPVAADDIASTPKNTPVVFDVIGNDTDEDGSVNGATIEIVTQPIRGGTVEVNPAGFPVGTIRFTPKNNFRGTDTFSYRVQDNEGNWSNTATVSVNVTK